MSLPKINISPEKLYQMSFAAIQTKLLITAIELKIFNHLSEPKTADQVAEAINSHPRNTMLFLNGLTACELLMKKKASIAIHPLHRPFWWKGPLPVWKKALYVRRPCPT